MTLTEHGDDLLAAELGEYLGFRAGRLDHDDLGLGALIRDGEMLGPDAVDRPPAFGIGGHRGDPQLPPTRALETRPALRLRLAPSAIHRPPAEQTRPQPV